MVCRVTVDWGYVKDAGFGIPFGVPLEDLVAELEVMLTSRDPKVRDDLAYPVLATWVERGVLDELLEDHGNRLAVMLGHQEPQARSFAVLALAEVVGRVAAAPGPLVPTGVVRAWLAETVVWYVGEQDPAPVGRRARLAARPCARCGRARGLRAVAAAVPDRRRPDRRRAAGRPRGAHVAAVRGRRGRPRRPGPVRRLLPEDVDPATVADWFLRARSALAAGLGGADRTPAWVSNTVRALQMLHLLVGSKAALTPAGVPVACGHAEVVKNGIVHAVAPWWPPLRP